MGTCTAGPCPRLWQPPADREADKAREGRQDRGHVPRTCPLVPAPLRTLLHTGAPVHPTPFCPAGQRYLGQARPGIAADVDVGAEDRQDVRGRDRRRRRALGGDSAVLEKDQPFRVGRGQVDVVLGRDDGLSPSPLEVLEDAVDLGLVADIEVQAGLVEQQQGRVLGQGPGDEDPLPLAAAQLRKPLRSEAPDLGQAQGLGDGRLVLGRSSLEPALPREPSHEDDLLGRVFEDGLGQLGDIGDPRREPPRAHPEDALAAAKHRAPDVVEQVLDGLDQRALARAVAAQDGDEFPRLDRERDVADDEPVLVSR